jgi:hypothetical protein
VRKQNQAEIGLFGSHHDLHAGKTTNPTVRTGEAIVLRAATFFAYAEPSAASCAADAVA